MRIKGKRVLKNGAIAGYVYYPSDKKWKWRIIGRKKNIKGGSESKKNNINEEYCKRILDVSVSDVVRERSKNIERNRNLIKRKNSEKNLHWEKRIKNLGFSLQNGKVQLPPRFILHNEAQNLRNKCKKILGSNKNSNGNSNYFAKPPNGLQNWMNKIIDERNSKR